MRIATWNVNSLKARQEAVDKWLGRADPDILLMQETKLSDEDAPVMQFQMAGYDLAWREMGREPLEGWDLVWLRDDGTYQVVPTTVNHADFLVRLLAYHQTLDLARRVKALGRDT